MKELSTEEKAQRYDEAINVARSKIKNDKDHVLYEEDIADIFPELEWDEDEKIRKYILKCCEETIEANDRGLELSMDTTKKLKNWLERQDKQKPIDFKAKNFYVSKVDGKIHDMTYSSTNEVKPKFHEGDWIVHHGTMNIYQVVTVIDNQYQLKYGDNYTVQKCADVDRCARLWDITKDAKDEDVLTGKIDGDTYILIYKQITDGWIETYGHYYNAVNRFCVPSQLFCRDYKGTFTPASKEQRNLLFSKMKEAGYEWDGKKKLLKKIEQKPAKWSEEDETNLHGIVAEIMANQNEAPSFDTKVYDRYLNWLVSIKRRMQ